MLYYLSMLSNFQSNFNGVLNVVFQAYTACSRLIQVIQKTIQGYLELRLIHARYVSGIISHINNVRHSEAYFPTFRYILADPGIVRILTQLDIFKYIQAYSEPLEYLASQRNYSRAIHAYSEPYLSRFRHIQSSGLFRHVMLHAYLGTLTKLYISRRICPH